MQSLAVTFPCFCASVAKKNIPFCRLFLTTERTEGAQSTQRAFPSFVVTLNLFQGLISSVFMSFRGKIFNHQEHREEAPSAVIFFIIGKMLK